MIEIHWLWIPLIVTLILGVLGFLFERDQDFGFFKLLSGIAGLASLIIYIVVGLHWLFSHIKITS